MQNKLKSAVAIAACAVVLSLTIGSSTGQSSSYRAPRTPDGKPNLNGIWQTLGTAHWDVEPHGARQGPVVAMGAVGAIPGGLGVVEGGEIPYQPWAKEKRKENMENWLTADPVVKCYMPGVPRATYMPFPFQIVQTPGSILLAYEFASSSRIVYMDKPDFEAPAESWMGHSRGHWEGETLVIDVTSQVADTWFDSAGNFHSDELRVVERYTPIGPDRPHVRGHNRGSQGLYPTLEGRHASLPSSGKERSALGIQMRGVCRRADVRASPQENKPVEGGFR